MKFQTLLSHVVMAFRRLFGSERSIHPNRFWRGKYFGAYPAHTTIIHYPDGIKLEQGDQTFFISYDQYPAFRDADTARIGKFGIFGDQAMWEELDIAIDLRQ